MLLPAAGALLGLAAISALGAPSSSYTSSRSDSEACTALWQSAPKVLSDLTIQIASFEEAGLYINDTAQGGFFTSVVGPLPQFCRFRANITTSNISQVLFEVWLPPQKLWNNDFMMVGNGGDSGAIYYGDMVLPLSKYGYAVASTNTGHNGDSGDGTFALNNPQSQIDFGHRAVHLTTVYSKKIVDLFYGQQPKLSYWSGCSSGGKQGLKEIQMYPDDYDAAIVGSPAYWWSHLNGFTQYVNALVNTPGTSYWINATKWASLYGEVVRQCDMDDGVQDGIILEPGKCSLDFSKFKCGADGNATAGSALNSTTCLTAEQLNTFKKVHTNWTDPSTGDLIFPAFNYGSEYLLAVGASGVPYGPAPSYFLYQVLNVTDMVLPVDYPSLTIDGKAVNESQLIDLVYEADKTNPGQTTADDPNLKPFFDRGGKLILYVGDSDWLIPTNSTHVYYEKVTKKLGNVSNSMIMYDVPGMGHCSTGPGAWNFGQPGQEPGSLESAVFDEQHDAVLALRKWRSEGTRPGALISASYNGGNKTLGVAFTRKLCPYPLVGRYDGKGNTTLASSYECRA